MKSESNEKKTKVSNYESVEEREGGREGGSVNDAYACVLLIVHTN